MRANRPRRQRSRSGRFALEGHELAIPKACGRCCPPVSCCLLQPLALAASPAPVPARPRQRRSRSRSRRRRPPSLPPVRPRRRRRPPLRLSRPCRPSPSPWCAAMPRPSAARPRPTTKRVWQRLVQLGRQGARFVVFGTASEDPEASAKQVVDQLQRRGAWRRPAGGPQVLVGGPEQGRARPGLDRQGGARRLLHGRFAGAHRRCAAAQWSDRHARRHLGCLPPGRRVAGTSAAQPS